jgi:hypothetical protein
MSPFLIIILGIVFVIIIYWIYAYIYSPSVTLSSATKLNQANASIVPSDRTTSTIFSYSLWVYIENWQQSATNIFRCTSSAGTHFSLDLPYSSPTLTCSILTGVIACTPATTGPTIINITNNVPIQRWFHVIVSVNTNIVDCYLDGKLITSAQLNGIPTIGCTTPASSWKIDFGIADIVISNFKRSVAATDPATANSYFKVAPAAATVFANYSANIQVVKDNVPQSTFRLF